MCRSMPLATPKRNISMFKEILYWVLSVFVTIYGVCSQKGRRKCKSSARLDGQTAVVTGCNTGIGKETVRDLYGRGARVIMACRNLEKANEAKSDIENTQAESNNGTLVVEKLDVTSTKSVREFASKLIASEDNLTLLVNNAGVMVCPEGRTEDGFETQFGGNHLGHFLLTLLLLPKLMKAKNVRIVTTSSIAHFLLCRDMCDDLNWQFRRYDSLQAYALSKAANIAVTRQLANKLRDNKIANVNTYSLHPGVVKTEISRHILNALPCLVWLYDHFCRLVMKTPMQGAQTTIYCAVDEECAGESGLYYSDCRKARCYGYASSDAWATAVWDRSIDMLGMQDYNPFLQP